MTDTSERERLKKNIINSLQRSRKVFLAGVGWGFTMLIMVLSHSPIDKYAIFSAAQIIVFSCGCQTILSIRQRNLRKIILTTTQKEARGILIKNILLVVEFFLFFLLCVLVTGDFFLFGAGLFLQFFLWLCVAETNRLTKLFYFQTSSSQDRYEGSSPCPISFRNRSFEKSLWALPLLLFALAFLFFLTMKFCSKPQISFKTMLFFSGAFSLVGWFLFFLVGLPSWLIKQTTTPSSFQRIIRYYVLTEGGEESSKRVPHNDEVAYKWWLSHPGQPWPDDMEELCQHIDTTSFDWHNPNKWPF